jgi:hypothetical protein
MRLAWLFGIRGGQRAEHDLAQAGFGWAAPERATARPSMRATCRQGQGTD